MGARTLFTIHNLAFQGLFPAEALADMGLDAGLFRPDALEFWGRINLVKGALEFSDALSTVSPTYAREIQTPEQGNGLDRVLRARAGALTGILNGVDETAWNPATDPLIPAHYSEGDLVRKGRLQTGTAGGFRASRRGRRDAPSSGWSRALPSRRDWDLVAAAAAAIMAQGYNLVALGTGDPEYEELFRGLAAAWPGRIARAHRL